MATSPSHQKGVRMVVVLGTIISAARVSWPGEARRGGTYVSPGKAISADGLQRMVGLPGPWETQVPGSAQAV